MFKRTIQRYGQTPEPVTPYQKAAQLWDERIGSARVQAKNWRLMAFGSLGLSSVLAGGMIWQSLQSKVVPYVVAVDKLGEAQSVAPAEAHYQPTDAQIGYFLSRFITDVRSLSIDPIVVRNDWLEAYGYVTERGARVLDAYAQKDDPFKQVGANTVAVQVTSVVRVSGTSFQVKWTEQAYQHDTPEPPEHWTAILTVVTKPPSDADELRKNPLGLYVDGIAWTRELNSSEMP
ncbi:MAG: conjugal transfer protein TrbF [Alphaproteobacteria bacterium]|nr:conjugal transfer protein TrbF [Alphaproteobacteria bacterium]